MNKGAWQAGLFDCTDDCGSLCKECLCPCMVRGTISEKVGEGYAMGCMCSLIPGVSWYMRAKHRGMLRARYDIKGSFCMDCCFYHACCDFCADLQEINEIGLRKGYEEAAARVATEGQAGVAMAAAPAAAPVGAVGYAAQPTAPAAYGAPVPVAAPGYGAPAPGYGAPAPAYGAPAPAPGAYGGAPATGAYGGAPGYGGAPAPAGYPQQQYPAQGYPQQGGGY